MSLWPTHFTSFYVEQTIIAWVVLPLSLRQVSVQCVTCVNFILAVSYYTTLYEG